MAYRLHTHNVCQMTCVQLLLFLWYFKAEALGSRLWDATNLIIYVGGINGIRAKFCVSSSHRFEDLSGQSFETSKQTNKALGKLSLRWKLHIYFSEKLGSVCLNFIFLVLEKKQTNGENSFKIESYLFFKLGNQKGLWKIVCSKAFPFWSSFGNFVHSEQRNKNKTDVTDLAIFKGRISAVSI